MAIPDDIRQRLCTLIRAKKYVLGHWKNGTPHCWRPGQVRNAEGEFCAPHEAWQIVLSLLETNGMWVTVLLEQPAGEYGYEVVTSLCDGEPKTYVKIQLSKPGTHVIGRSFHPSNRE